MANFTIKSRAEGDFVFFVGATGGYVYLESVKNHGTLGRQICKGGRFTGSTISASPNTLESVARRWYRAYRKNNHGG